MAYRQESCPLCGRNMTAIEKYPGRGELYCDHCDLTIGGNDAKTPEELMVLMDGGEHKRLKAKNAKLQELVRHMYTCMDHVEGFGVYYDCESCVLNNDTGECDFEERIRALGIEV